jgi:hypothetical protein
MISGRLNVFQRLVRRWDKVHPYNAAQVLRIAGRPDLLALRRAWHATLAAMGLGPARVRGIEFEYEAVNGNAARYDVPLVPPGVSLEAHLTEALNAPFTDEPAGDALPLRPFVLDTPDEDSFYVGVVYTHWIADSASIRMLLREWFVRVYDPPAADERPAVIPTRGYWGLFGPHRTRWRLGEQFLALLRSASRFRRVRKIKYQGSRDYNMRFTLHRVPPGVLQQLLGVAKRAGVTLNDLFLAVMADVCDRFNPIRAIPHRQDLALGVIVDLRSRARQDMSPLDVHRADLRPPGPRERDVPALPQVHAAGRRHLQREFEPHVGRQVSPRADQGIHPRVADGADGAAGVHDHDARRRPALRAHLPVGALHG